MDAVQTSFNTMFMRNSGIFRICERRLSSGRQTEPARILSFGCSIGDEIASLRFFFPGAEIFACDVNPRLVDIARNSIQDNRVHFIDASSESIRNGGPYDLIVASAVLCRNPSPPDYAAVFPFTRYDDIVALFDECLRTGGLLAIPNAGYLFMESSVYNNFRPLRSDVMYCVGFVDIFRKDGTVFLKQVRSYGKNIYSRHGESMSKDNEDIFDCLFEKSPGNTQPQMATLSAVPQGLEVVSRMVRRNVDYSPAEISDNFVVVEERIQLYRDSPRNSGGYSVSVGWSSFLDEGMYYRDKEVWIAPRPPN